MTSSGSNTHELRISYLLKAPIGNPNSRYGTAGHYLGYTGKSLKRRLAEHQAGTGAKITRAAAKDYGRELELVRHWSNGTRALERELKRRHCPRHYCPRCNKTTT